MKANWIICVLLSVVLLTAGGCSRVSLEPKLTLECKDPDYRFSLMLPESWRGFSILHQTWEVRDSGEMHLNAKGPTILVRHPQWTDARTLPDIPVWVFTPKQWQDDVQNHMIAGGFVLEVGRTDKYVFGVSSRLYWPIADSEDKQLNQIAREADAAVSSAAKLLN